MTTEAQNTVVEEVADLDALLSAMDQEEIVAAPEAVEPVEAIEELDVAEAPVEAVEAVDETLDDDFLADLEVAAAKASAYETQAAEEMPDIAETIAGTADVKVKKTRTTSKAASPAAPRAPRDLASVPAEFFDVFTDSNLTEASDLEAAKTGMIGKRPGQVKIAEKFDNLFIQLAAGRKPSTYVMLAVDLLNAKSEFSSADLIGHYKANGLGDGTARSQTGQIMVLFDTVGIAQRVGQKLTKRANSKILERIAALATTPAPAPVAAA